MRNNKENSQSIDLVMKVATQCIGYDLPSTKPGDIMSNEEFENAINSIFPHIRLKVINEWKMPKI